MSLRLCVTVWLLWITLSFPVRAEMATVGQPFPVFSLADQHGVAASFVPGTRFVIVASDKDSSTKMNEWLHQKPADFLNQHDTVYIADIEPMPALITRLFALPKMRKYPYRVLLAREKSFAATYPSQPGKIAVFVVEPDGTLADIQYPEATDAIETLIASPPDSRAFGRP